MLLRTIPRAAAVSLLLVVYVTAQVSPSTPRNAHVQLVEAPSLERGTEYLTIVRWTVNNPGGSPVHYGIVHYGVDPKHLDKTAQNPIRLNLWHPTTMFRVRINDLKAGTTYYYSIEAKDATGPVDMTSSTVYHFSVVPDSQYHPAATAANAKVP